MKLSFTHCVYIFIFSPSLTQNARFISTTRNLTKEQHTFILPDHNKIHFYNLKRVSLRSREMSNYCLFFFLRKKRSFLKIYYFRFVYDTPFALYTTVAYEVSTLTEKREKKNGRQHTCKQSIATGAVI